MRFYFHLPKLADFSKRKKLFLLIVLGLFLILSGVFFTLRKMGKLGTWADSVPKTINVSGVVTDAATNEPIAGVTVNMGYKGGKPLVVLTDAKGYYQATTSVDAADPVKQSFIVQFIRKDYFSGDTDYIQKNVLPTDPAVNNFSQNYILIPKSTLSTSLSSSTQYKTQSVKASISNLCNKNTEYSEVIEGVTFCAFDVSQFEPNRSKITSVAKQIKLLRTQAGFSTQPEVELHDSKWTGFRMEDGSMGAGFFAKFDSPAGGPYIAMSYGAMDTMYEISHEMGHYVDWQNGYDSSNLSLTPGCFQRPEIPSWHCYTTSYDDFRVAAKIASGNIIYGYAEKNAQEMYAEIFAIQQLPQDNYANREKLKYAINNFMLSDFYVKFNDGHAPSGFQAESIARRLPQYQNAAMYIYKFVAGQSKVDEYFPGTVERMSKPEDIIKNGNYMTVGVVPVKARDFNNGMMNGAKVAIGSSEVTTRSYDKDTPIFSDKTVAFFDTSGTNVLAEVTPGSQVANMSEIPAYLNGAVYLPEKVDIIKGANWPQYFDFNVYASGPFAVTNGKPSPADGQTHDPAIGATGVISVIDSITPPVTDPPTTNPPVTPPNPGLGMEVALQVISPQPVIAGKEFILNYSVVNHHAKTVCTAKGPDKGWSGTMPIGGTENPGMQADMVKVIAPNKNGTFTYSLRCTDPKEKTITKYVNVEVKGEYRLYGKVTLSTKDFQKKANKMSFTYTNDVGDIITKEVPLKYGNYTVNLPFGKYDLTTQLLDKDGNVLKKFKVLAELNYKKPYESRWNMKL